MDRQREILLERAKQISGRRDVYNQIDGKSISVIEFLLIPERYAFEEIYVSEVLFLKEITTVPGVPPFVMGVINLRGKIISIVNLKNLFNLKDRGLTELNKVMILKNDKMEFGVVADSITGNKSIFLNTLSPPPITLGKIEAEYIRGITPDGLILLNADCLLSSNHLIIDK